MRAPTRRLLGGSFLIIGPIIGLVIGLALGLAPALTVAPAQAAAGSPPVTVDDKVKLRFGQPAEVEVLANDSDPDGDDLEVCRLGAIPRALEVFAEGHELFVAPGRRNAAGTYTFTYYACDFEFLTPATVTVTVTAAPEVKVQKLPERPGVLRVRNTASFPIVFMYGSFRQPGPDGTVPIAARNAKFVHVRRTRIDWIASARRTGAMIDTGSVRNITLPPGVRPSPSRAIELAPQLDRTWQRVVSR